MRHREKVHVREVVMYLSQDNDDTVFISVLFNVYYKWVLLQVKRDRLIDC